MERKIDQRYIAAHGLQQWKGLENVNKVSNAHRSLANLRNWPARFAKS